MRVPGFRSRLIDSIQCSFQNVLRSSLRLLLRLEPNEPHRYLRYRPSENPPPWYCEDEVISVRLTEEVRKFYLDYTGLEGSALEKRLREIRGHAWQLGTWPTFGSWIFAQNIICSHPYYPQLVADLKEGAVLLEAGCGLGQDLRYLAHDGAPTINMIAIDERRELWELGKALFGDVDNWHTRMHPSPAFKARFIQADLANETRLSKRTVDIVMANNFFNVAVDQVYSNWAMRYLIPSTKPGTIFLGYHIASDTQFLDEEAKMYYYNREGLLEDVFNHPHRCKGGDDARWEELVYVKVDLETWGLERRDWTWIRDCLAPDVEPQLYGAFFAMRRVR